MKKALSLILTLCLLFGALPVQAFAAEERGTVRGITLTDGFALENEYLRAELHSAPYMSYLSTLPTATAARYGDARSLDIQTAECVFETQSGGAATQHTVYTELKSAALVDATPNGKNPAIRAEYGLTVYLKDLREVPSGTQLTGAVTVYYELVHVTDDPAGTNEDWGVLATVGEVCFDRAGFPEPFPYDFRISWVYSLNGFPDMGRMDTTTGVNPPAVKLKRVTVEEDGTEAAVSSSVITSRVDDVVTRMFPRGYIQWGDVDGVYTTEAYIDGYPWANPFAGLSDYYANQDRLHTAEGRPIRAELAQAVSVKIASMASFYSRVEEKSYIGHMHDAEYVDDNAAQFLWGYRDLVAGRENVPTEPDKVDSSFAAQRLAAFAAGDGVRVEYVADDAAMETLKKQYGKEPAAVISGSCESANGASFTFTGGAALLSPSVSATWNEANGGKLIIHRDGRIEQHGVHLNAPTFKFYQPAPGAEDALTLALGAEGFTFDFEAARNDAIISVDIPYASVKIEQAKADASGNLVFTGNIGFQTVFDGAEFTLEKLGYGLEEKTVNGEKTYEFKVNGVHAAGKFNTAALLGLELAKVEGEVNTFKNEERYAFSLELNAFDLFETEAELALERYQGTLIPDKLWFYVKAGTGIVLIPPIPIGQLNGGGAGFSDLARTVKGDYFAIPPLKLRGALTGTYLHLVEGTGNIVLGPSEISLKATDVGLIGASRALQIVESFGYTLRLDGQERNYGGETYKGVYFAGSEEMTLNLPTKGFNIFEIDSGLTLGAFGGVNDAGNSLYLGVGANGIVRGTVRVPDLGIPFISGLKLGGTDINLIIGGQTTAPIRNVSVSEGMKQAFENVDIYLGAMAGVYAGVVDARLWVLVPKVVETKFRMGEGWGVETKWFGKLGEWNWSDHGVTPVVQSAPVLYALRSGAGVSSADIVVENMGAEETPYILLAFDESVTAEQVKAALTVEGESVYWVNDDCTLSAGLDKINAATDVMSKTNGERHRVALLRLPAGGNGTYHVSTEGVYQNGEDTLLFTYEQDHTVPFERLELTQNGNQLDGLVKYPEAGATYVLRTYLGAEEGAATYLVDERNVKSPYDISVTLPASGTLAPTGDYYPTSFLMTEREADLKGNGETERALVQVYSRSFDTTVHYLNTKEPDAPASVTLAALGNETMTAAWSAADGADGYRVRIYQEENGKWTDTGFGYDLDGSTTDIRMAMTVGGNAVKVSESGEVSSVGAENLSADENYRVGVSAYKIEDGAKYYSPEALSGGSYLSAYAPLAMTLAVNETACEADENGVYHALAGGGSNVLTVSAAGAEGFAVTRMDTNASLSADANDPGRFELPDFTGTLMLRVDGAKGMDVTSEYLLVSRDETAPVLTLSADVFYADQTSGAYAVTGTADAGSKVFYSDTEFVYAGSDGRFTVPGALDEGTMSKSFCLCAQDGAGNASALQLAFIARRTTHTVTVNGSYATPSGAGEYAAGETVTVRAGSRAGYRFDGWTAEGVTLSDASSAETTFPMPDGDVTLTASWTAESGGSSSSDSDEPGTVLRAPFDDVPAGAWYFEAVRWAVEQGITTGTDARHFSPNETCTRAQIVTFLYRAAGSPEPSGTTGFADVSEGAWYAKAVAWAVEQGITNGTSDALFAPNAVCDRAQAVTLLHRFARAQGMDTAQGGMAVREFDDFDALPAYCTDAMGWAVNAGVLEGAGGRLMPVESCTRAQIVTLLWRLCK